MLVNDCEFWIKVAIAFEADEGISVERARFVSVLKLDKRPESQ